MQKKLERELERQLQRQLERQLQRQLTATKLQPPGGTILTAPSGLRSRVCGQSLRPSLAPNHFWSRI